MASKKKILIVTQELPPTVGGAGVVAWQNAKLLAHAGHSVTLLAVKGTGHRPTSDVREITVHAVPRLSKLWVVTLAWRLRRLPLNTYDTIILNDVGAVLVFSLFFPNSSLIQKALMYLHGGEVQNVLERPKKLFRIINFRKRYIDLARRCKALVAVSAYMKDFFLERCRDVIAAKHVQVIYAGIDEELFYPKRSDLHTKLGIPTERTLLLSVSRTTREKGYATMLGVFADVIAEDPNFHWIVVGDGPYLNTFKEQAAARDLSGHITCVGAVPRSELAYYYSGAHLYWLLSERKAEAFGLVYAEAQACGVPVIGPRHYGVIEAVREGISGYLVDSPNECVPIITARKYLTWNKNTMLSFAKQFYLDRQRERLEAAL